MSSKWLLIILTSILNAEPPLFFYHLPKCGGTTIHAMIAQKFHEKEIYHIVDTNQFFIDSDQLSTIRFFAGHIEFYYGNIIIPDAKRITFLRDPIARIQSHYHYAFRGEETPPPFREFAAANANLQVKMLSSYPLNNSLHDHLESAKANLQEFFFIGLVERMSDSMEALYRLLNWPPLEQTPLFNACPAEAELYEEELLLENWADLELYKWASAVFEERLTFAREKKVEPESCAFVDQIHYTFDQPLDGEGWSYREQANDLGGKCIRTTYQLEAFIKFPLRPGKNYHLDFTASAPLPSQLQKISILVNGIPVMCQRCTYTTWSKFKTTIPKELITEGKTKITFKIPILYKHKNDKIDSRSYGIRVSEIHLET